MADASASARMAMPSRKTTSTQPRQEMPLRASTSTLPRQDNALRTSTSTQTRQEAPLRTSTSTQPRPSTASSSHLGVRPSQESGGRGAARRGAKPVAPSWHRDAPFELKVKEPSKAVLLPQLSISPSPKTKVHDLPSASQSSQEPSPISPLGPQELNTEAVLESGAVKLQRPNIKVRIITWNQGGSVPKGDLGVLLGRVGEYIAPEQDWDVSSDEEGAEVEGDKAARTPSPMSQLHAGPSTERQGAGRRRSKARGMGVAGQEHISRKDRIPPLPYDDAHPYHIVVVAGQECPWGDGKRFSTGVGLAGELGDLGRSKSRAAFLAKEREKKEGSHDKIKKDDKDKSTQQPEVKEDDKAKGAESHQHDRAKDKDAEKEGDKAENSRAKEGTEFPMHEPSVSVMPATPGALPTGAVSRSGAKGWSDMCEDWFCRGPLAQATATKGITLATTSAGKGMSPVTPSGEGSSTPLSSRPTTPSPALVHPGGQQPASNGATPASPSKRVTLAVPRQMMTRTLSKQRLEQEALRRQLNNGATVPDASLNSTSPPSREQMMERVASSLEKDDPQLLSHAEHIKKQNQHRLALRIPGLSGSHQVTVQSDGTPLSLGAYELVIKERCYMMYTAVYVWRGCLDRVRGVSHGIVKSGLLSGRVGNKGAVGISLQLGSSRLLFVNAHLAAHEGRVAERIANIEKIKRELKVETFLPKDDPRNEEHDLTASFDYSFWFGDLNFRVDISRKHADWLMLKKQYDHALAFDQLRKVMKEQPEVLQNFLEAPITFPPTFKYDVLKSLRSKKRDIKALRHRSHEVQQNLLDSPSSYSGLLNGSSTADASAANSDEEDDTSSTSSHGHIVNTYHGETVEDRELSSGFSIDNLSASPAKSTSSSVRHNVVASNTAAAEGMSMHGKAIRARKKLFKILTTAVDTVTPKQSAQMRQYASPSSAVTSSNGSAFSRAGASGFSQRSTTSSKQPLSASPRPELDLTGTYTNDSQAPSSLRNVRRGSAATSEMSTDADSAFPASTSAEGEKLTNGEGEAQRFDSSAKQRVPSWCDRVLWRSNIAVEEDELEPEAEAQEAVAPRSRIGLALSNAFNRLHYRSESITHVPTTPRDPWRSSARATPPAADEGDGEKAHKSEILSRDITGSQSRRLFPHRRRDQPQRRPRRSQTVFLPESTAKSEIISSSRQTAGMTNTVDTTMTALEKTDSTPAKLQDSQESAPAELLKRSQSTATAKRGARTLSLGIDRMSEGEAGRRTSSAMLMSSPRESMQRHEEESATPTAPARHRPQRSASAIMQLDAKRAATTQEDMTTAHSPPAVSDPNRRQSSPVRKERKSSAPLSHRGPPAAATQDLQLPAKVSWWADRLGLTNLSPFVPSSLSGALRNSAHEQPARGPLTQISANQPGLGDSAPALIGPKGGVVECLLYKSLNDREMRTLEGRSDHRPVIFVGAIGIGGGPSKVRQGA